MGTSFGRRESKEGGQTDQKSGRMSVCVCYQPSRFLSVPEKDSSLMVVSGLSSGSGNSRIYSFSRLATTLGS